MFSFSIQKSSLSFNVALLTFYISVSCSIKLCMSDKVMSFFSRVSAGWEVFGLLTSLRLLFNLKLKLVPGLPIY